eukprot:14248541-Alexandrium_andersonii.AAC.1
MTSASDKIATVAMAERRVARHASGRKRTPTSDKLTDLPGSSRSTVNLVGLRPASTASASGGRSSEAVWVST